MINLKFTGWRLILVSILLIVPFFSWACTRINKMNSFDNNCEYHIRNFQTSDNLDASIKEGNLALNYLESHNLTNGYTSIMVVDKNEDIKDWYDNFKKDREFIENLKSSSKFDDFIAIATHKRYDSTREVKVPDGISIYPHNIAYAVWFVLSGLLGILGVIGIIVFIKEKSEP